MYNVWLDRPAAWLKESVSINLQCIYKTASPSVDDVLATIDGKNLIMNTNISIEQSIVTMLVHHLSR